MRATRRAPRIARRALGTAALAPQLARLAYLAHLIGAGTIVIVGSVPLGCVATAQSGPTRGVVVSGPPPAPLLEERPPPPPGPSVWIAGYWHWSGMQYAWIPGHWELPPPGAVWSGPRYVVTDGTTIYEPGAWKAGPGAPPRASAFH